MTRTSRLIWVGALVLALAACNQVSPSSSPSASARPSNPDSLPAGQPVRIDEGVAMSADNRVVTLRFIGGVILPASNPCATEYAGWAKPAGEVLNVAVILLERANSDSSTPIACAAAGADRHVEVELDQPFEGAISHDVPFGTDIPIERP